MPDSHETLNPTSNEDLNPDSLNQEPKSMDEISKEFYGGDVPEFNPTGAKVLAKSGFNERHDIVESSFNKARKSGEKLHGRPSERRSEAYISRIESFIDKHGNEAEKRLWEKSAKSLIVKEEDIPDSYWQQQILRDREHGNIYDIEQKKTERVKEIQEIQKESIESWSNYLGSENSPYPTWFKLYAWDGMSKMGVFDKDRQQFTRRDKTTVAPFPKCNPAVLAKTFSEIEEFYDNKDSERMEDGEKQTAEMEALVQSNNFNKLYSKILLNEKAIPKTPERTEDVRGQWVEYTHGQEKQIANAAEGTEWCVADPGTARHYLKYGTYGNSDYYNNMDEENDAKFILFRLENPETNTLSESACASVRLDPDGTVAEISGLNKGQALEDSLVPIVEKKVLPLPGGENYVVPFADKKELIRLYHKMQNDESLTKEEYEFLYEFNRPIETLDTYNEEDPKIGKLREKYKLDGALDAGVDPTALVDKFIENGESDAVAENLDKLISAGADIDPTALADEFIENGKSRTVADNLDKFISAGVDPTALADKLIENREDYVVANNLDKFISAGADIDPIALADKLIKNREDWAVVKNLDEFLSAGTDPTTLADKMIENRRGGAVAHNLDKFIAAGADIDPTALADKLIEGGEIRALAHNLDKLISAGADIDLTALTDKLIENREGYDVISNLNEFAAAGVDPTALADKLIENGEGYAVADNLDKFISAGADIDPIALADKLIENREGYAVDYNLDKFISAGVDPTALANKLIEDGRGDAVVANNLDEFISAGANPTALADEFIENGKSHTVANNLDKFVSAGADPTALADKLIKNRGVYALTGNLDKFISAGADIDPTALADKLIENGESDAVAENLDKLISAGADIDPTALADKLIENGEGLSVTNNLDRFISAGIDPTALADKLIENGRGGAVAYNLDKFISAGANREEIEAKLQEAEEKENDNQ